MKTIFKHKKTGMLRTVVDRGDKWLIVGRRASVICDTWSQVETLLTNYHEQ